MKHNLPPPKFEHVSANTLREMFNKSQYPSMIANGLLIPEFLRDAHLKEPQKKGEAQCTRGQMIRYKDEAGQWIVEVFRYLRSDGTIGGSGRPDPKNLRIGNTVYSVYAKRKRS